MAIINNPNQQYHYNIPAIGEIFHDNSGRVYRRTPGGLIRTNNTQGLQNQGISNFGQEYNIGDVYSALALANGNNDQSVFQNDDPNGNWFTQYNPSGSDVNVAYNPETAAIHDAAMAANAAGSDLAHTPMPGLANTPEAIANQNAATATNAAQDAANRAQNGGSVGMDASALMGLGNLGPGSHGQDVSTLQNWLMHNGYLSAADIATGPGIYGPKTTAAVAAWQAANGIDTGGNPGYFGPHSHAFLQQNPTGGMNAQGQPITGGPGVNGNNGPAGAGGAGTGTGTGTGGTIGTAGGPQSTGNPQLDSILSSLQRLLDSNKAAIPPGLQITPELTQQFLTWAHQSVDPQTQQLIGSEIANINASLKNMQTDYESKKGEIVQDFGTKLADEQNTAGANGTAFSGLRNLTEENMANSTNRSLASLAADTAGSMGAGMRAAGANVGAANAGGINMPSLTGASVGIEGGSRGSVNGGNSLDFGYNPSLYTAGTIPSNQNTAVNNLAGNYLNQYTTLAGANSGRSMGDLIGMVTGLPQGYSIPSNLH